MPASNRSIAIFGDDVLGFWGVLLADAQPRLALASLSTGPSGVKLEPAVLDHEDDEVWLFAAGANELKLERGSAATTTDGTPALEPVRITGSAVIAGEPREIDVAGSLINLDVDKGLDSIRAVGSWFPAGHQISLRASRPRGAKGQDKDVVDVIALGEQQPLVFDPRLSTTYGADGEPRRAGIELWIGADEDGDQYPRRVAGVATGSSLTDTGHGVKLSAHAMRCLSRGEAGVGVYVLLSAN